MRHCAPRKIKGDIHRSFRTYTSECLPLTHSASRFQRTRAGIETVAHRPSPPRLGLTVEEAAAAVGMSESSFKRHVQPELRIVRRGSLRIIPVPEIEKWLAMNATMAGVNTAVLGPPGMKRPRTTPAVRAAHKEGAR